jgi:hypothetical protein
MAGRTKTQPGHNCPEHIHITQTKESATQLHQSLVCLCCLLVFSHPDYTVGPGTSPGPATLVMKAARGLYRRSGIGKRCFPHLAPKTWLYSIVTFNYNVPTPKMLLPMSTFSGLFISNQRIVSVCVASSCNIQVITLERLQKWQRKKSPNGLSTLSSCLRSLSRCANGSLR